MSQDSRYTHNDRANPFPEVANRICRLPLLTLSNEARGYSPWRPDADISTWNDGADAPTRVIFPSPLCKIPETSIIEVLFSMSNRFLRMTRFLDQNLTGLNKSDNFAGIAERNELFVIVLPPEHNWTRVLLLTPIIFSGIRTGCAFGSAQFCRHSPEGMSSSKSTLDGKTVSP